MHLTKEAPAVEAARACLYAVVDRFNTEDAFWSSFVPEFESSTVGADRFSVTLLGRGVRLEVQGVILSGEGAGSLSPRLVVGATPLTSAESPRWWHPITCSVDEQGRFVTSNFRKAIENAIDDLKAAR